MLLNCSEFNISSLDEIRLFWKGRDGWKYIETTAFGLESPETDLSNYVSQNALFYLEGASESGYIGRILEAVKGHYEVSPGSITMCRANIARTR